MAENPKPTNVLLKSPSPVYARISVYDGRQFSMEITGLPPNFPILFDTRKEQLVITSNGYELTFMREDRTWPNTD
jgi:hypothetical protein